MKPWTCIIATFSLLWAELFVTAGQPVAITFSREATYTVAVPRMPYNGSNDEMHLTLTTSRRAENEQLPGDYFGGGFYITRSISGTINGRRFALRGQVIRDLTDLQLPQSITILQERGRFTIYLVGGEAQTRYSVYLDFKDGKFQRRRISKP